MRGVEDALAHYSLDGDNMHASLEALRELIDTDKIILYSLEHGVARSSSNATIAAELKVAERTVEAHVTAILEKAHVPSRAALSVQIFA